MNKYEVSLWEDIFNEDLDNPHFEEQKIAIIGSDSMEAGYRARDCKLTKEINQTTKFSFTMFYKYIDNEDGLEYDNPFLNLLVNERKIKVFWDNEWYDFVIKNCDEQSSEYSITYECTDAFVNELSKTGFQLVFDSELENNTGNIQQLAEQVMKNTDWKVSECDHIQQFKEEAVYETRALNSFTAIVTPGGETLTVNTNTKMLVYWSTYNDKEKDLYFVISRDQSDNFIQETNSMLIDKNYIYYLYIEDVTWSESTGGGYVVKSGDTVLCLFNEDAAVSNQYRAEKPIRTQMQTIDSYHDQNVYEYTASASGQSDKLIYKHEKTVYYDATFIMNLVANPSVFSTTSGWLGGGIVPTVYNNPKVTSLIQIKSGKGIYNNGLQNQVNYISDGFAKGDKYVLRISGFKGIEYVTTLDESNLLGTNSSDLNKFQIKISNYSYNKDTDKYSPEVGQDYFTFGTPTMGFQASPRAKRWYINITNNFNPTSENWYERDMQTGEYYLTEDTSIDQLKQYYLKLYESYRSIDLSNDYQLTTDITYNIDKNYYIYIDGAYQPVSFLDSDYYIEWACTCKKSITPTDLKMNQNCGIIITTSDNIWIKELQFFKEAYDSDGIRINPGDYGAIAIAQTEHSYYDSKDTNPEINYYYRGLEDTTTLTIDSVEYTLTPIYTDDFEKIRSITEKESNRFNILQSLAETFECWLLINVDHDSTGKITYDEDGNINKYIKFVKDIGEETGLSFVYGIDLQTIQRQIESEQIVTKTIVKDNSNEYAIDSACTIGRSAQNYPRANYILNFDYFISHGLIEGDRLNKDLYDNTGNGIGLYYYLHQYNTQYDEILKLVTDKQIALTKKEAEISMKSNQLSSTIEERTREASNIMTTANLTDFEAAREKCLNGTDQMKAYVESYDRLSILISNYTAELDNLQQSYNDLISYIEEQTKIMEDLTNNIDDVESQFYSRYSRFLQEGSWQSDDYFNDDQYYLDAVSVAYTSSRPTVKYNISVLRLNSLEEFVNKKFNIGDIGFIEDTDFFGYTIINGIRTPYKEKVLISQIVYNFEEPDKDQITVQNYKSQFEDLFQRITATTQSLQYASGSYQRAANILTPMNTISSQVLQDSFTFNQDLVLKAQNEKVELNNDNGITLYSSENSSNIVRLTSEGIMLSRDGGSTWRTGITGAGISTSNLTAGKIDVGKIVIYDGDTPTFQWDGTGLNAYYFNEDVGVDWSKFVRFDQYGLYGVTLSGDGVSPISQFEPESEEDVWDNAHFALTWKGFLLKNNDNGSVQITSDDDIQVIKDGVSRIKIGRIGTDSQGYIYGIKIADADNNTVMQTDDQGKLWLENKLNISSESDYNIQLGNLDETNYIPVVYNPGVSPVDEGYYEEYSNAYIVTDDIAPIDSQIYYTFNIKVSPSGSPLDNKYFEKNLQYDIFMSSQDEEVISGKEYYEIITQVPESGDNPHDKGWRINVPVFYILSNDIIEDQNKNYYKKLHQIINANNDFIVYEDGSVTANSLTVDDSIFSERTIQSSNIIGGTIQGTQVTTSQVDIYNGGLTIYEKPQESESNNKLLYTTVSEDGNITLYIQGSGEFTGTGHFNNGEFSGSIISNNGKIGGFYISDHLISDAETLEQSSLYLQSQYSDENGDIHPSEIYAKNLIIGSNAKIENSLQIGPNSYIYNTDLSDGIILAAENFSLTNNGTMKLGEDNYIQLDSANGIIDLVRPDSYIKIDSSTSSIIGYRNTDDESGIFNISTGRSIFKDVEITGVLHTSVFASDSTQQAGGSMIFRPAAKVESYIITTIEGVTCTKIELADESKKDFNNGDIIGIAVGSDFIIDKLIITDEEEYYINQAINPDSIVNLAHQVGESAYNNNLIIGINSTFINSFNGLLKPNSITFSEYNGENDLSQIKPVMALGNLNDIFSDNNTVSGYGIYAENAFLTGSITTKNLSGDGYVYAGLNTLNGAAATIFGEEDQSKIIFWGGSASAVDSDVQNSPFQVTERGSLYASRGKFTGSVITDSYIEASELYAVKIFGGTKEGENAAKALQLYQLQNGIEFYTTRESESADLTITNNYFKYANANFFEFVNDEINLINLNKLSLTNGQGNSYDQYIVDNKYELNLTTTEQSLGILRADNIDFNIITSNVEINTNYQVKTIRDSHDNIYGYDLYIESDERSEYE